MELEWKEPPTPTTAPEVYADLLRALKANPGRWARVAKAQQSGSMATTLKNKHGMDAVSRVAESDPKKRDIYARAPETPTPPRAGRQPTVAELTRRQEMARNAPNPTPSRALPARGVLPLTTVKPKPGETMEEATARVTAERVADERRRNGL